MRTGIVIYYSDDTERPRAEVVLRNGDRIKVILDRNGVTITQSIASMQPGEVLFRATSNIASRLCAGLFTLNEPKPTPLRILVAAIIQLSSAEEVRNAFREASAKVS